MTKRDVDDWLERYVEAWRSYDPEEIGALFAEDVEYRYHPYDEPLQGRDAVVRSWRCQGEGEEAFTRDDAGTYEGAYETIAVAGETAVATGTSTYTTEPGGPVDKIYDNCFVMRFDSEGRCCEFTEWFMKRPPG